MSSPTPLLVCARPALTPATPFTRASSFLLQHLRLFSTSPLHQAAPKQAPKQTSAKDKAAKEKAKRRRKRHTSYKMPTLSDLTQYNLCDAMQYIRAFEVGRPMHQPKFDLAIRFKTKKSGPVVRNAIKLPYSVKTDVKVCVIAEPGSKAAKQAKDAGAYLVGDEEVFRLVKEGKIDFDRCLTTPAMLPRIQKEGLPRILGPRGLMPSAKLGTVTEKIADTVGNMLGGSTYRERQGVVRMAVGQLGFSPEMLRDNIKAIVGQIRKEASALAERDGISKEVWEIVLSSTHSPGFSLNGEFRGAESRPTSELTVA